MEAEGKYCENYLKPATNDTENQQTCQELCLEHNACIGISYSYKQNQRNWCYICLDDHLNKSRNDFGFYRRLGTFVFQFIKITKQYKDKFSQIK